jgi:hypothetical protein
MTDTFRALCAELLQLEQEQPAEYTDWKRRYNAAIARVRAALAQSEPVAPTDEELSSRFRAWWHNEGSGLPPLPGMDHEEHVRRISEIAWANGAYVARYGTPANEPVPVSERPWEREGWCDAEGQCWMGDPGGAGFIPSWRLCRPEDAPSMTCSLPANALPTPEPTNA